MLATNNERAEMIIQFASSKGADGAFVAAMFNSTDEKI